MNNIRFCFAAIPFLAISFLGACNANSANTATPGNAAQVAITETFTSTPTNTPTELPSSTPIPSPTATPAFTNSPTLSPTSTSISTPVPTETPDIAKFDFQEYIHPSGMFRLDMANRDTELIEIEDAVYFTDGFHLIMAGFTEQELFLDSTTWMTITQSFADQFLITWSLITSFDSLERQEIDSEDFYLIRFNYFAEEAPINKGLGEILLIQQDSTIYGLVLLTPKYHDVEFVWEIVKESFAPLEE